MDLFCVISFSWADLWRKLLLVLLLSRLLHYWFSLSNCYFTLLGMIFRFVHFLRTFMITFFLHIFFIALVLDYILFVFTTWEFTNNGWFFNKSIWKLSNWFIFIRLFNWTLVEITRLWWTVFTWVTNSKILLNFRLLHIWINVSICLISLLWIMYSYLFADFLIILDWYWAIFRYCILLRLCTICKLRNR